jgi:hypothetical protein
MTWNHTSRRKVTPMQQPTHPIAGWMQLSLLPFLMCGWAAQTLVASNRQGLAGATGDASHAANARTAVVVDLAAYRQRRFASRARQTAE